MHYHSEKLWISRSQKTAKERYEEVSRKRGNGEGTIHRRNNGGWCAQYVVHTADGPKRRTLYGKTRQEVANKLAKALSSREDGLVFEAGKQTVGEYLERWLEDCVKGTVRASTLDRYKYAIGPHIKPALGRMKLKSLTPAHVRGFYREKLDTGLASARYTRYTRSCTRPWIKP